MNKRSRKVVAKVIAEKIPIALAEDCWSLSKRNYKEGDTPLDFVQFNHKTKRYEPIGSDWNEDDVIFQALVMMLLYCLDKGWGQRRCVQALSIWTGEPPSQEDDDDEVFQLDNLWKEEVEELIQTGKLGSEKTLGHYDSFAGFQQLYRVRKPRYFRRSACMLNYVHVLSEQAAIQFALKLREEQPAYPTLAALVIHFAHNYSTETIMSDLAQLLLQSAERADTRTKTFCKQSLEDIENDRALD
jgi:hypothetical protein